MSKKTLINLVAVVIIIAISYFFNDGVLPTNEPTQSSTSRETDQGQQTPDSTGFDYYVLALSWSPSFCASDGRSNKEQCGPGRDYAFIVHGLWPQFNKGGWPEDCAGQNAPRVPNDVIAAVSDIMPSKGLIIHEWRKHGTCTGDDPKGYYSNVRAAYERVEIPQQYRSLAAPLTVSARGVRDAFLQANPGLTDAAMTITCDNRLREVRVCMDQDFEFRSCSKKSSRQCKSNSLVMLPSR